MDNENTPNVQDPKLRYEKIDERVLPPTKPKTDTDAGYDVYAWTIDKMIMHSGGNGEDAISGDKNPQRLEDRFQGDGKSFTIQQGERVLISTGLKVTVEPGWEIQVRPRSGLAWKKGLTVLNAPGTIDESYRGELKIILVNTSRKEQYITLGDAIAQIVPKKVTHLELEEVNFKNSTKRGSDGFGSTDEYDPNKEDDGLLTDDFEIQDKLHNNKLKRVTNGRFK